ncbi:MAG TPA: hypothetical protein VEU29_01700 [Actinomycetota bacterium]|nr:hypothetical protein [Actinomycetota bacterium]
MTRSARAAALVAVVATMLAAPPGNGVAAGAGPSSQRSLVLPIPPNQTWYVCQGYNGQITHAGQPALDLSLEARSVGPDGCLAGSKYSSAGSVVTSPGDGVASRWPGCCGDDFVCVDLDSGGSVAVGHLSNRVPDGTRVATGQRIGTVAWPHPSNGDFAHVHVQAHPAWGCTDGGGPVAFDVAHGFKWRCTPDLPYSGAVNQYSGMAVSRCGASAAAGPRKDSVDLGLPSRDDGPAPDPRRAAIRLVELLRRSMIGVVGLAFRA